MTGKDEEVNMPENQEIQHDEELAEERTSSTSAKAATGTKSATSSNRTSFTVSSETSGSSSGDEANQEQQQEEQGVAPKKGTCPFNDAYSVREHIFVVCAGMCLSFNSGYVNGTCLSGLLTPAGARQSVSGFTGTYTISALSLANGDIERFGFLVCMFLSFMCGSFTSGLMTPRAKAFRIAPTYGPTFFVGAALLTVASVLAITNGQKYLFYFAAAANGVQNGMSSMYTANLIRTTHLTGTSTDIGLIVGQIVRGNKSNVWKLKILVGLAFSFWLGGLVSFFATTRFTSYSLLFNSGLFFAIGLALVVFLVRNLDISIRQAFFGTWEWEQVLEKLNISTRDGQVVSDDLLMEVFDSIDHDGNGYIEEHELYNALKQVGVHRISRKSVKTLIGIADDNSDGMISKEEWLQIVHKVSQSSSKRE